MGDPVEVELKLEYDPADRARLLASPVLKAGGVQARRLVATYFDTPDLQLKKAGFALRIRKEGNKRVQTVKASDSSAAGLFVRGEWDRPVRGNKPVLDERAGPLGQMLDASVIARIAPIFLTDIERVSGPIEEGGTLIEYAVDCGEARAGTRGVALSELELELKHGSPRQLFDLARRLDEEVPLRLGVRSKSARGYALVSGGAPLAFRGEAMMLDRETGAGEAFAIIAGSCIRQYRLNEALLLAGSNAEAVHQARVAIRRLRSAFALFRPLLDGDDSAGLLAAELRWLAGQLGEIRDIDVLLPLLDGTARELLSAARDTKFAQLRHELERARVRQMPIELAEWLAVGRWRSEPADPALCDQNIRSFAGDRLDRLRRRIKREGRGLAAVDDKHRHEVRKDAKKLRYAAEFLVSLYPGRKARRRLEQLLDRIETLQDKLGRLNDIAAAPELFARLGIDMPLPAIGKKQHRKLLAEAEDCFDALIDTKRFWRV
jgi:inorganic triphosphatase YgiF